MIKETFSAIGGFLIYVVLLCIGLFIAAIFIQGAAWVSEKLFPLFSILTWITFGLAIFIFLPLAIPKCTRGFSSVALFVSSYVFGATLWMLGLWLTLMIWGPVAVFIGLFIAGIGVVPIAMLATLIDALWVQFIELILLTILMFASRIGAFTLAASLE